MRGGGRCCGRRSRLHEGYLLVVGISSRDDYLRLWGRRWRDVGVLHGDDGWKEGDKGSGIFVGE